LFNLFSTAWLLAYLLNQYLGQRLLCSHYLDGIWLSVFYWLSTRKQKDVKKQLLCNCSLWQLTAVPTFSWKSPSSSDIGSLKKVKVN